MEKEIKRRKPCSEETKKRISLSNKGMKNEPQQGFQKGHNGFLSGEDYRKIGEKFKEEGNPFFGKKHTKESRLKMRLSHLGKIPGNKGKKLSEEVKNKIWTEERRKKYRELSIKNNSIGRMPRTYGDEHPNWGGDGVNYQIKHSWVRKIKGHPEVCEHCGKIGETINGKWNIDWANIDHKYRRVLEDYIGLCVKCHRKYDIENNIYGKQNRDKELLENVSSDS